MARQAAATATALAVVSTSLMLLRRRKRMREKEGEVAVETRAYEDQTPGPSGLKEKVSRTAYGHQAYTHAI